LSLVGAVVKAAIFWKSCRHRDAPGPSGANATDSLSAAMPTPVATMRNPSLPQQPLDSDQHLSGRRELDRVRHEIGQNLAQPRGIAEEPWRICRNFFVAIDVSAPAPSSMVPRLNATARAITTSSQPT
jgi:hypothetical protein